MNKNKTIKLTNLKSLFAELKGYEIISYIIKDEDGKKIKGTFEGEIKLKQPRNKTTNQVILETIQQLSENIDSKLVKLEEDINSKLVKMEEDINSKLVKLEEDMNSKFTKMEENINSKLVKMEEKINSKLDLIIQCPTIQKEIDHEALSKIK